MTSGSVFFWGELTGVTVSAPSALKLACPASVYDLMCSYCNASVRPMGVRRVTAAHTRPMTAAPTTTQMTMAA